MNADHRPPDAEDPDLGAPITQLRDLQEDVASSFATRVRGRIQDRMFAGQLVDFSMPMFFRTILEYISMAFAVFGSSEEQGEGEDQR